MIPQPLAQNGGWFQGGNTWPFSSSLPLPSLLPLHLQQSWHRKGVWVGEHPSLTPSHPAVGQWRLCLGFCHLNDRSRWAPIGEGVLSITKGPLNDVIKGCMVGMMSTTEVAAEAMGIQMTHCNSFAVTTLQKV